MSEQIVRDLAVSTNVILKYGVERVREIPDINCEGKLL